MTDLGTSEGNWTVWHSGPKEEHVWNTGDPLGFLLGFIFPANSPARDLFQQNSGWLANEGASSQGDTSCWMLLFPLH